LLQAHPDIDVLFGWASQDAVGLAQAAREAGKTDPASFLVTTVETDPQVFELIKSGSVLQISLDQNSQVKSIAVTRLLVKALSGETIPPTAVGRATLVTVDNADAMAKRDANPQDYPDAIDQVLVFSNTPLVANGSLPPDLKIEPMP
jgi:ribose transport system substrate-binding protein